MSTTVSLKYILPRDVLSHVYQYDPTYRNIFTTQVLPQVWIAVWQRWKHQMLENVHQDPRFQVLLEHLIQKQQDIRLRARHSPVPDQLYLNSPGYSHLEYYDQTVMMDVDPSMETVQIQHPLWIRILLEPEEDVQCTYDVWVGPSKPLLIPGVEWFRHILHDGIIQYRHPNYCVVSVLSNSTPNF